MPSLNQFQTPIVFIVFNRPGYERQVLDAIRAIQPARMYIVADGPRRTHPEDEASCAAARALIETIDWPCEVLCDYAQENMGSGRRIASGLDWVFQHEEQAIVLEDDFVPHLDFFRFCAEMLERYRDDSRISTVTGANFLSHLHQFPPDESYFFSRYYAIAGWATWRRAWRSFDFAMKAWPMFKQRCLLEHIYPDPYVRHYFDYAWGQCARGERPDVWDFQWMFACAAGNGLCIVPRVNLTTHIGVVGTHSAQPSINDHLPRNSLYAPGLTLHHPRFILANPAYDVPFFKRNFHPASANRPWSRIKRRLRRVYEALTASLP